MFQLTTSRRGRLLNTLITDFIWLLFQLTTSRRGRHLFILFLSDIFRFNSRPHEEVDCRLELLLRLLALFQLTTSRRGRLVTKGLEYVFALFQLTTSRRGRLVCIETIFFCTCFNSRPHEEVDSNISSFFVILNRFNSRPHEEVDYQKGTTTTTFGVSTHDLTKRSTWSGI